MPSRKKKNIFSFLWPFGGKKKKKPAFDKDHLSDDQVELQSRLEILMENQKPFLRRRYSIRDMSADINIPSHQLSGFINRLMGMHFSDYLNRSRIRYCENLIKDDPTARRKLTELAFRCGFNNRNSFTMAFKKFTGQTPSDYAKHR